MKIQIRILLIIVLPIFSVYGSIKFLSNYDQGIKSSDYIYRSSILNISFNISTPLISYKNYINEIDLTSWNNFTWSDINIKYPSFLNIEMYHAESISEVFDTVVIFNYYNNEDSSNYSIVRFFLTDKTFEEVAFSLGFDTTSAMHKKYSQITLDSLNNGK